MTDYLKMAASHLMAATGVANRMPGVKGWALDDLKAERERQLEMAREYAKLAAIDKGIAFPADPGETGQPS